MIRSVPAFIEGYGPVDPFAGAFARLGPATRRSVTRHPVRPRQAKLLPSIRAAIEACGLKDGATVSFHHHLRNGDDVLRVVMAEIAAMGFRDVTVAATSLFPVHARWSITSATGWCVGSAPPTSVAPSPPRSPPGRCRHRRFC